MRGASEHRPSGVGLGVVQPGDALWHAVLWARELTGPRKRKHGVQDHLEDEPSGLGVAPPPVSQLVAMRKEWLEQELVHRMFEQARLPGLAKSMLVFEDHSGFAKVLELAAVLLGTGRVKRCIVGGIDAWCDPDAVSVLQALGVLKTPENATGFMPGEAAAFLVVERFTTEIQGDKSHLDGNSKVANKGCVTKCVGSAFKNHHGSYRKNGYHEHKAHPVKSMRYAPIANRIARYRPVLEQQIGAKKGIRLKPKLPVGNQGLWNFTGKNFKNANTPFPHMYHHIVPWEVVSETFAANELKLLQRSGYNLNDGINLIVLPCSVRIGGLIGMYSHPNDHPTYTLKLIEQMTNLRSVMTGEEEEHLKKEETKAIKNGLDAWVRTEWFELATSGLTARGSHVDAYSPGSIATAFANVGP